MREKSEQRTPLQLRRRKMLLVLPLLALPFIALVFWALGGGRGGKQEEDRPQGLNQELPGAQLSSTPENKLSLYNKAYRDSMERIRQRREDPFALLEQEDSLLAFQPDEYASGYQALRLPEDPNEAKVQDRLRRLEQALAAPDPTAAWPPAEEFYTGQSSVGAGDLARLERMIGSVTDSSGQDPELEQLNGMLETILDIQHPDQARKKLEEASRQQKGRAFAVQRPRESLRADLMTGREPGAYANKIADTPVPVYEPFVTNKFYGLNTGPERENELPAIPAVVHETQTLVNGATVKMRLLEDIMINGLTVPAGSFVFGTCSINGERLLVEIPGIRFGRNLLPVSLRAYDMDAIEGIRIPGAITRDAAKEGADRMLQSVQLMSLDPSIAAQAAGAGVEVAKGLFGRKAKLVRVTVKAGYPLLLMDQKTLQELN